MSKSKKLDSKSSECIFPLHCGSGATKKISTLCLNFIIPLCHSTKLLIPLYKAGTKFLQIMPCGYLKLVPKEKHKSRDESNPFRLRKQPKTTENVQFGRFFLQIFDISSRMIGLISSLLHAIRQLQTQF